MLIFAIVFITLALFFYTIGVWSEKLQGTLKKWHLVLFWLGLVFDTTATTMMGIIAKDAFQFDFHGISGILAIVLMVFHAVWATLVLIRNNEKVRAGFHKFSLMVWAIWLIPYLSGMLMGMSR